MENELTCCVCLDLFTEPLMLPCSHNFCKKCLWDLFHHSRAANHDDFPGARQISCPKCRREVQWDPFSGSGAEHVPLNKALDNIVRVYKCTNGTETQANIKKCLKHVKLLGLYCQTCKRSLCEDCVLQAHSGFGHLVKEIDDFIQEEKDKAKESIQEIETLKTDLLAKDTEVTMLLVNSKAREIQLRKAVDNQFEMIKNFISTQQSKAVNDMSSQIAKSREHLEKLAATYATLRSDIQFLRNGYKDALQETDPERQLKLFQNLTLRLSTFLTFRSNGLPSLPQTYTEPDGHIIKLQDALYVIRELQWTSATSVRDPMRRETRETAVQTENTMLTFKSLKKNKKKVWPPVSVDVAPGRLTDTVQRMEAMRLTTQEDDDSQGSTNTEPGPTDGAASMVAAQRAKQHLVKVTSGLQTEGACGAVVSTVKGNNGNITENNPFSLSKNDENGASGGFVGNNSSFVTERKIKNYGASAKLEGGSSNGQISQNGNTLQGENQCVLGTNGNGGFQFKKSVSNLCDQGGNKSPIKKQPSIVNDAVQQNNSLRFYFGNAGQEKAQDDPLAASGSQPHILYFGDSAPSKPNTDSADIALAAGASGQPIPTNDPAIPFIQAKVAGKLPGSESLSSIGSQGGPTPDQMSTESDSQPQSKVSTPTKSEIPAMAASSPLYIGPALEVAPGQCCGVGARPKVRMAAILPKAAGCSGSSSGGSCSPFHRSMSLGSGPIPEQKDERKMSASLKEGFNSAVCTIKSLCRTQFSAGSKENGLDVNANDHDNNGAAGRGAQRGRNLQERQEGRADSLEREFRRNPSAPAILNEDIQGCRSNSCRSVGTSPVQFAEPKSQQNSIWTNFSFNDSSRSMMTPYGIPTPTPQVAGAFPTESPFKKWIDPKCKNITKMPPLNPGEIAKWIPNSEDKAGMSEEKDLSDFWKKEDRASGFNLKMNESSMSMMQKALNSAASGSSDKDDVGKGRIAQASASASDQASDSHTKRMHFQACGSGASSREESRSSSPFTIPGPSNSSSPSRLSAPLSTRPFDIVGPLASKQATLGSPKFKQRKYQKMKRRNQTNSKRTKMEDSI